MQISWAPDSQHVVVAHRNFAEPMSMDVFDTNGRLVRSFVDFDEALWLDNDRLVLTRYAGGEHRYNEMRQPEGAISFLASLGSGRMDALGENLGASETGGNGALAVPTCWICRPNVGYYREVAFRIWTPETGFTEPIRGDAYRWSAAGERLLVEHPLQSGPARDSWWEILSYPEMTRFARGGGVLNADFTRAARASYSSDPTVIRVTDLDDGDAEILSVSFGDPLVQWDASGGLLLNNRSGDVALVGMDGIITDEWHGLGHIGDSWANETTHAFWFDDAVEVTGTLNVLNDGQVATVHVPGQLDRVIVAPDGSAVAVACFVEGRATVLVREF